MREDAKDLREQMTKTLEEVDKKTGELIEVFIHQQRDLGKLNRNFEKSGWRFYSGGLGNGRELKRIHHTL